MHNVDSQKDDSIWEWMPYPFQCVAFTMSLSFFNCIIWHTLLRSSISLYGSVKLKIWNWQLQQFSPHKRIFCAGFSKNPLRPNAPAHWKGWCLSSVWMKVSNELRQNDRSCGVIIAIRYGEEIALWEEYRQSSEISSCVIVSTLTTMSSCSAGDVKKNNKNTQLDAWIRR